MNIAFISAEVAPFSKTGGLGDVSAAYPKAMKNLGHNIIIITPLYKAVDTKKHEVKFVKKDLYATYGNKAEIFELYSSHLPGSEVPVYFVKNSYLYRDGIYTDEDGEDYSDSPIRFTSFIKSVFVILEHLNFAPDIIHSNDWHSGLLPFYLKTEYSDKPLYKKTKSVFTIHNIGYQGIYPIESMADAEIPDVYLDNDLLGFYGQINFMKAAIIYSDVITTVSSKYAEEIQTKKFGYGLEKYISERKDDLYGIVHGIDLTVWNPKVDPLIKKNYDSRSLKGKNECKLLLQKILGLELSDKPLIAIVSRLATQKGLDLVLRKFDHIMDLGVQFVILGTGEEVLEEKFKKKEKKYPHDISINITFDNTLAHQIEAGADMFLMPSRYEPCGLNQIYSMIYGTVPVVRKTGGLSDTVVDYDEKTEMGNGFVFERINAEDFLEAVTRAVNLYKKHPEKWKKLQRRIMNLDFSWKKSAKQWQKVYEIARKKKR